ncbi:MAG: hypothetical protein ISQ21_03960 [Alphaproteobacteria bacterium]|nr:hypothetical protein [Alphaproteobacteria bacterium]
MPHNISLIDYLRGLTAFALALVAMLLVAMLLVEMLAMSFGQGRDQHGR